MSAAYLTKWSEDLVLAYFWTMVHADADRIVLLKQISGVAIERPDDWDRAEQRAAATPNKRASICFSCLTGDRRLYWHHVIAIQHGGSTCLQNLVPICLRCHALVHPWLDASRPFEERRGTTGWTRVGDMIVQMHDDAHPGSPWVAENGGQIEPTHWMSLPDPPVAAKQGDSRRD